MTVIFVRDSVQHANLACVDPSKKPGWGNVRSALLLRCWEYRSGISQRWPVSLHVFPMGAELILLRYRWSIKLKSYCMNWVFDSYVCAIMTKLRVLKWNVLISHV